MSKEILGETFDIHGGGIDLIFLIMKMKPKVFVLITKIL